MQEVPQRQRKRRRPTKVPVLIAFGLVLSTNLLSHLVVARRIIFQATFGVLAFMLGFWGWMVHAPPRDLRWGSGFVHPVRAPTTAFPRRALWPAHGEGC